MENEIKSFGEHLAEIVLHLKAEFLGIRTNKPTTKLVEDIKVTHYGQTMPMKALGTVSIAPPRDIVISVWDLGAVPPIAKAIEDAKLGLTPNIDGATIRLTLPTLTDERRTDIIKLIKKITEELRIKIRLSRDEINKKIKRAEEEKQMGENESFKLKEKVQKMVEATNKQIEELMEGKIKEINE